MLNLGGHLPLFIVADCCCVATSEISEHLVFFSSSKPTLKFNLTLSTVSPAVYVKFGVLADCVQVASKVFQRYGSSVTLGRDGDLMTKSSEYCTELPHECKRFYTLFCKIWPPIYVTAKYV